jgi:hypothetical protein
MNLHKLDWTFSLCLFSIILLIGIMIGSIVVIGQSISAATETLFEAKLGKPLYTEHYRVTSSHSAIVDGKKRNSCILFGQWNS